MKIAAILDHVDSGHFALPQFQRGYVWNRSQVRALFQSLYMRHPVGGLLIWNTESETAKMRGDSPTVPGMVNLLLDGQQRVTSMYGIMRGKPPAFFEGNATAFTGLRFHLKSEAFEFYQPTKMKSDPLWIDVSTLMQEGMSQFFETLQPGPEYGTLMANLSRLKEIDQTDLAIEELTGKDKTLDVVVDIFNRVNSGGTKLSKGDLAFARISAAWPNARKKMNAKLEEWKSSGYDFDLDWLIRSITTILTGRAQFEGLQGRGADEFKEGFDRAVKQIETCLNLIANRLGLDHDRVFFGKYAVPVMAQYLDVLGRNLEPAESSQMLYWYVQASMWGRFSGSTESNISQDLATLEAGGMDALLEQLRLSRGGFGLQPDHFSGWSISARFYPILYMLTRTQKAVDLGSGLPLSAFLLGKMSQLEMHHIFPKSLLYKHDYKRNEVNALANFCFLTKDTNLNISNRKPEVYLAEVEEKMPGALGSQWIPQDPALWQLDRYLDFLEERRKLLAKAANELLYGLLPQEVDQQQDLADALEVNTSEPLGGISSEAEAATLDSLNMWVAEQGLSKGRISYQYDFAHEEKALQPAILDLAWPIGLQAGLSEPIVVLLNEPEEVLEIASAAGFRCFTSEASFKDYVQSELMEEDSEPASFRMASRAFV